MCVDYQASSATSGELKFEGVIIVALYFPKLNHFLFLICLRVFFPIYGKRQQTKP
jgi:hypothetical protein